MIVLVVEDEINSRMLLSKILAANGYEVLEASNGIEALKKIQMSRPDIIISDIMMPEMDGFQLCRELRKGGKVEIAADKIYQVDSESTRRYGGVGVGLAISRYLIELWRIRNESAGSG
ncbi:MAG TPA: response regulator [Candidatus Methanoperedens sp.]